MLKTKTIPKEQASKSILPLEIQEIVDERGFYLYEWIDASEFLWAVQLYFLNKIYDNRKLIKLFSITVFVVILSLWMIYRKQHIFTDIVNFIFLGLILSVAIFCLWLSLKYIKCKQIVCMKKIVIFDNKKFGNGLLFTNTKRLEEIFFKPVFGDQFCTKNHEQSKLSYLIFQIVEKFGREVGEGGILGIFLVMVFFYFKFFFSLPRSNTSIFIVFLLILPVIVLILLYKKFREHIESYVSAFIYILLFIPFSVFILLFSLLISLIIKLIIFFTHYTETRINSLFTSIEKSSNILQSQKQKLLDSLESGTGFYEFQKVFLLLSRSADSSINNSHKLEKLLRGSKFHDIFDFEIYHSWIRKQVREPLEQILNLMEDNLQILNKTKEKLIKQIAETIDQNLRAPLELQLIRMDEQMGGFERNGQILRGYLERLE